MKMYDLYGKINISVPDSWTSVINTYQVKSDYSIFASSADRNQAVAVSEIKNMLNDNAQRIFKVAKAIQNMAPGAMLDEDYFFFEINGMKALQYEEENIVQSTLFTYLNTVIETRDAYYLVTCWTASENYGKYEGLLKRVTNSFALCPAEWRKASALLN